MICKWVALCSRGETQKLCFDVYFIAGVKICNVAFVRIRNCVILDREQRCSFSRVILSPASGDLDICDRAIFKSADETHDPLQSPPLIYSVRLLEPDGFLGC